MRHAAFASRSSSKVCSAASATVVDHGSSSRFAAAASIAAAAGVLVGAQTASTIGFVKRARQRQISIATPRLCVSKRNSFGASRSRRPLRGARRRRERLVHGHQALAVFALPRRTRAVGFP